MIRLIAILIGLFFSGWLLVSAGMGLYTFSTEEKVADPVLKYHEHAHAPEGGYSFDGPFGTWDTAQLQRGLKVYSEVCSACHSLRHVAFGDLGGIGYSEDQAKNFAASKQVPAIDPETGEASTRDGTLADKFPSPYRNDVAARAANNNALPPDLSLITKARHNGTAYVYSLLTGYGGGTGKVVPKGLPEANRPGKGLYYNPYFANLNLAMMPPLKDGQVEFDDGSPNDLHSMAKDVSAFLTWTAEPKLVQRRATGWAVLIFLLIATTLAYLSYRTVWADKKH